VLRDPVALAHRLVDIPSVSGEEAEAARFVAGHLADLGYQVEVFEAAPGRPNVLATTDRSPRVVLSTHLDTVPPHLPAREEAGFLQGGARAMRRASSRPRSRRRSGCAPPA